MSQQTSAIELLGYAAASLTTLSFIPQAMRTLSSGDTRGISLSMYAFFTSGIALWLVYGIFVLATQRHKHLKKKRPPPSGSGPSLGRKRQSHDRGRNQSTSRVIEWRTSFKGSIKKSREQGQKSGYQT